MRYLCSISEENSTLCFRYFKKFHIKNSLLVDFRKTICECVRFKFGSVPSGHLFIFKVLYKEFNQSCTNVTNKPQVGDWCFEIFIDKGFAMSKRPNLESFSLLQLSYANK